MRCHLIDSFIHSSSRAGQGRKRVRGKRVKAESGKLFLLQVTRDKFTSPVTYTIVAREKEREREEEEAASASIEQTEQGELIDETAHLTSV